MSGRKDSDQDILKAFEEDSDAFFDSLLSDAGLADDKPLATPKGQTAPAADFKPPPRSQASAAKPASLSVPKASPEKPSDVPVTKVATPGASNSSIESEYDTLQGSAKSSANTKPSVAEESMSAANGSGATMFRMDDDDEDAEAIETASPDFAKDDMPPEAPPAPANFTADDLALREALSEFYLQYKPDNVPNVNSIVSKYRGIHVPTLWAQLALKYNLPPTEGVSLLSKTLYLSSPFEYQDRERAADLAEALEALSSPKPNDRAELFKRSMAQGAKDGSDGLLRMLSFRGVPEDPGLRPQVWKVLLGYLPMRRHDEWNGIQGEKRALYASYKSDLVEMRSDHEVGLRDLGRGEGAKMEAEDLLQEIKNDVDRTRKDLEYFRKPATKAAMIVLLFVYARLNPGVRYVQGMNEVAAVILYVMSVDPECAEADTFWCFSELMAEIKDGFMQALDHSGEGVYGIVESISAQLRSYDPTLARHLQKNELSLFVFVLRWCTVLFAQDASLPDVLRLWDSFIADPSRFEFVIHVCVAVILGRREELLETDKQFALAEMVQSAARCADFEELLRRAQAICAFERREGHPVFPPPRSQVVDDLTEWATAAASEAAAVASGVGSEVSKNLQEKVAPVVLERAEQASAIAAVKVEALQSWLQETAPARQEALDQASTQISSLWETVKSKGAQVASEVNASETASSAASGLSVAAASASGFFARASAALAQAAEQKDGQGLQADK